MKKIKEKKKEIGEGVRAKEECEGKEKGSVRGKG